MYLINFSFVRVGLSFGLSESVLAFAERFDGLQLLLLGCLRLLSPPEVVDRKFGNLQTKVGQGQVERGLGKVVDAKLKSNFG